MIDMFFLAYVDTKLVHFCLHSQQYLFTFTDIAALENTELKDAVLLYTVLVKHLR